MQDDGLKSVVAALIDIAGTDDVFKVVEADEIIEKLPEGLGMDKQGLSVIIRDLKGMGYLEVKYFTPDEYCLLVSRRAAELLRREEKKTEAEPVAERAPASSVTRREKDEKKSPRMGLKLLLAAFVGGAAGGALVMIIAVIVLKLAV